MPHRPRAPVHHLSGSGTFFVTSGTYQKAHYFPDDDALKGLHGGLLKYAAKHKWTLEAWAVFSNHYHFVAHSPPEEEGGAETLRRFPNRIAFALCNLAEQTRRGKRTESLAQLS